MPRAVDRILAENTFDAEADRLLRKLQEELPNGAVRPLRDDYAPDADLWQDWAAPYVGQSWLDVPWFFAEAYFFRRVAEAVGFFRDGEAGGRDPYAYQKRQALEVSRRDILTLAEHIDAPRADPALPSSISAFLQGALWGNQADLNLWPADEDGRPRHDSARAADAHLLIDGSAQAATRLLDAAPASVALIADNAGLELVSDLALVDFLLRAGVASTVTIYLKKHPMFVSDAMVRNVEETFRFLEEMPGDGVRRFATRLRNAVEARTLLLKDHFFWTSPLPGWAMPEDLQRELGTATLVISKGDANFRRLLGDRHWPYTTPFADIVCYFPAPLLTLRTHKSEVACGLTSEQINTLDRVDSTWRINGHWGGMQYADPSLRGSLR